MTEKTHSGALAKTFSVASPQDIKQYRFVKRGAGYEFVELAEDNTNVLGVSISYRTGACLQDGGDYTVDVHLSGYGVFVETEDATVALGDKVVPTTGGLALKSADTSGFTVIKVCENSQVKQPNGEIKTVTLLAIDLPKQS